MITNRTLLDFETQIKLSRHSNDTSKFIGYIAGAIFLIIGILYLLTKEEESPILFGYIAIGVGAVILIVFIFFWDKIIASAVKKGSAIDSTNTSLVTNIYTFHEDSFDVKSQRDGRIFATSTHAYTSIKSVIDTPNYFILNMSLRQAFIINKSGTKGGSNEELAEYLKRAQKYSLGKK